MIIKCLIYLKKGKVCLLHLQTADSRQQCRGVFPCNNSFAQLNIGASKACPTPGMPFLLSLSGRLQTNMFFYRRSKMPLQRRVANCWLKARIIVILRLDKRR